MLFNSKLIATAIVTIVASAISGQAAFAKVESVGVYDGTCREFIELIDAGDEQSIYIATAAITWVEGYLSGVNAMNSQSIDLEPPGLDKDARIEVIVGFCRATPDATMEQVAAAYYLTLLDYQDTPTS